LVYVSGAWTAQRPRYIVGCFVPGVMTASQLLLLHTFTKGVTIPGDFGAYLGHMTRARGTVNATGTVNIDVRRAVVGSLGTFTSVGTLQIGAGQMVLTGQGTAGSAPIVFGQGDSLSLVAPVTPDATFADFAATLVGYET
jgi:hypothetical protein